MDTQWAKVARAVAALEDRWMSHLNGPLDMGQVAAACALEYLDLRHAGRGWRADHPDLVRWVDAFGKRDAMVATVPPT